ncbi:Phosphoadenosine phosphosulfate reductase thioredoxin [Daedalea quercina L-15889]|uniref:Phosphoadenosine phosphosulfate reductase thioredoxin n=1 Tax=Daedalea quercina L-15889 TaxID=1314783 RepID=A0A165S547_9APHY|nr:Phosphoadenosine phosphosulfate reductase thioredoxin [Daedalea quercina L-15889]
MSGEASSSSLAFSTPLQLPLSKGELDRVNAYLSVLTPEEILRWAVDHLPGLYQTTAFGLTGLVAVDMLSKITPNPPPLIFIDTLYHFSETLELVEEVQKRYGVPIHVYKPEGCETVVDFEMRYGEKLWEMDETLYDYAVKVEPARRAYEELGVKSVITGRRASQGADRANLSPLEVDSTGLLKLNPLFAWTFPFVEWYVKENNVPRNKLLDQGYRSVGDWHSTVKSGEGDAGERAGRWVGKKEKTECGLHVDYLTLKAAAQKKLEQLVAKNDTRIDEVTPTSVAAVETSA